MVYVMLFPNDMILNLSDKKTIDDKARTYKNGVESI